MLYGWMTEAEASMRDAAPSARRRSDSAVPTGGQHVQSAKKQALYTSAATITDGPALG